MFGSSLFCMFLPIQTQTGRRTNPFLCIHLSLTHSRPYRCENRDCRWLVFNISELRRVAAPALHTESSRFLSRPGCGPPHPSFTLPFPTFLCRCINVGQHSAFILYLFLKSERPKTPENQRTGLLVMDNGTGVETGTSFFI